MQNGESGGRRPFSFGDLEGVIGPAWAEREATRSASCPLASERRQWQQQVRRYASQRKAWDIDGAERTQTGLIGMAKSLDRYPQLESLLRNRRIELGLKAAGGASLSHELADRFSRSRSIVIGF